MGNIIELPVTLIIIQVRRHKIFQINFYSSNEKTVNKSYGAKICFHDKGLLVKSLVGQFDQDRFHWNATQVYTCQKGFVYGHAVMQTAEILVAKHRCVSENSSAFFE